MCISRAVRTRPHTFTQMTGSAPAMRHEVLNCACATQASASNVTASMRKWTISAVRQVLYFLANR